MTTRHRQDAKRRQDPLCDACGEGRYRPTTKPKVLHEHGRVAVVTDIPVAVCDHCGNTVLDERVMTRLDDLFSSALATNSVSVRSYSPDVAPEVTAVRVLHDYVLEVSFADGTVGAYDFAGRLWGPAFEPLIADYELFCSVRVSPEAATIAWPVGDDPDVWPDWAPEELYEHIRAQYEDADHRLLADEPEDHPAAHQEPADSEGVGAAEFAGVPATGPGPGPLVLRTDLNAQDDDGHGLALVASDEFQPDRVYPGARVIAGNQPPDAHALVTVLRTELFETTGGEVKVLVTFDKGGSAQN